jgi:uncharacterized protein DUF4259
VGAWGELAFDNDDACDWAFGLDKVADLSLVASAFTEVEAAGQGRNLEPGPACEALAACEVLARLKGRPGYVNAYTENVDRWVATHRINPPPDLVSRGNAAIDRILGDDSELRELWAESGDEDWLAAVADLRSRLTA